MLSCVMNQKAADYADWKLQQLICTLQTDPQSEDPLHAIFTAKHLNTTLGSTQTSWPEIGIGIKLKIFC